MLPRVRGWVKYATEARSVVVSIATVVTALGVLASAVVAFDLRYAKAADLNQLRNDVQGLRSESNENFLQLRIEGLRNRRVVLDREAFDLLQRGTRITALEAGRLRDVQQQIRQLDEDLTLLEAQWARARNGKGK